MSLLDLRRAHLQVCVHKSLWPFQIVKVDKKRYCLTRLGFGLNVVPLIMKTISIVLAQEETELRSICVHRRNEDVVPMTCIREHLAQFRLECKDLELLKDGA